MTAIFPDLITQIVSSYCANNTVGADALPGLIHEIYRTLASVNEPAEAVEKPVPAVPPKRSVSPDYIVCLEDGKKLKMLKRHLQSAYGMTPADYRARWDLPQDYPMVAPNYAERRSALAKQIGLGRRSEEAAEIEAAGNADADVPGGPVSPGAQTWLEERLNEGPMGGSTSAPLQLCTPS